MLQIGTKDKTFVFDLVALSGLPAKLRECLEDGRILKVVFDHRAEHQALENSFGCKMESVLDLQKVFSSLHEKPILNGFVIRPQPDTPSLWNVVRTHLGFEMDKTFQTRSWMKEEKMPGNVLKYAAGDAAVLIQLLEYLSCAWDIVEKDEKKKKEVGKDPVGYLVSRLFQAFRSNVSVNQDPPVGPFPEHRLVPVRQSARSRVLGDVTGHFLYM